MCVLLQVFWQIVSDTGRALSNFVLNSSYVELFDGMSNGQIVIGIVADGISQLTELYRLILTNATNGADIDSTSQISLFSIQ